MAVFDINKYRQMFLEEAEDIFETIDTILLEAEESGDMDNETVNSLFRSVHTLKGNSASVELAMFAALAHELEFFMDRLRNGELAFEESMAELLIEGIDTLKQILEMELSDALNEDFYQKTKADLLRKIEAFSEDTKELMELIDLEEEKDDYGLLFPIDEDEGFGPLSGETIMQTEEMPESMEEYFGLFEDETPEAELLAFEDVFGFFDDLEEVAMGQAKEETFGFFDEPEPVLAVVTAPSAESDDDHFGFFMEIEPRVSTKIAPVEMKSEPKPKAPVLEASNDETKGAKKFKADTTSNSIRVDLSKIDGLMNNIGELVIAHSMLSQYIYTMEDQKTKSDLGERLELIDRHIRELQESVMSVRMVPMETVFSKFPKVIRDTAKKLDKKIDFRSFGETVEIDKAMIEGLTDPLMHIVRNGLDHGIESPEKRLKAGKPESGTLIMSAEQANGQMIIKIQDDGGGINLAKVTAKALENGVIDEHQAFSMSDEEKAMLIFAPGLSTADAVTDISGRGVGMDVVMSNIKKLGGIVKVDTEEGYGSTFTIALPLTLAILDGLNIRVGHEQFILPLSAIIESIKPEEDMIKQIGDTQSEVLMLRNEFIPVVRLHTIFNVEYEHQKLSDGLLIVVRSAAQKIALFVDEFMNQQQFVIKPLDRNFRNARGIGGATVRGDGTIGLIIDTMNILDKNY
jgi:two-component system, chemotaxis family, sensor kinase CheA